MGTVTSFNVIISAMRNYFARIQNEDGRTTLRGRAGGGGGGQEVSSEDTMD